MNITKKNKLGVILLAVVILAILILRPTKKNDYPDEFIKYISSGITTLGPDHLVYIKIANSDNTMDTANIIVSNISLRNKTQPEGSGSKFVKKLADCIINDKPMKVSSATFNSLKDDRSFTINKELDREFYSNGAEYYIDEEGWLKGFHWDPRDSIQPPRMHYKDTTRQYWLYSLIRLLQKENIGVYFYHDDEVPEYCGYRVWRLN